VPLLSRGEESEAKIETYVKSVGGALPVFRRIGRVTALVAVGVAGGDVGIVDDLVGHIHVEHLL